MSFPGSYPAYPQYLSITLIESELNCFEKNAGNEANLSVTHVHDKNTLQLPFSEILSKSRVAINCSSWLYYQLCLDITNVTI